MEHPVLNKIATIPHDVRIYAYNGVAIAFANEIEDEMFWCFFASSAFSWEQAVDVFYDKVSFSTKHQKTDTAVSAKLRGTKHEKAWAELNRRTQSLLGKGHSIRNVIGHNAVTTALYANAFDLENRNTLVVMRQEVRQKRAMVERRNRPETLLTDAELRDYCAGLIECYLDLNRFADRALSIGNIRRQRYARTSEG